MDLMHKLAKLSEDERQRLIGDFLDAVFGDLGAMPSFAGVRRSMTPELPDDPEAEQVQAWAELAELSQDPGFRGGGQCDDLNGPPVRRTVPITHTGMMPQVRSPFAPYGAAAS